MARTGILAVLSGIWPFCLFLRVPKLEFENGIPRSPQAEQAFKKFLELSAEEIEAIPVDPELEKVFETFEEMSEIIENATNPQERDQSAAYMGEFVPYAKNINNIFYTPDKSINETVQWHGATPRLEAPVRELGLYPTNQQDDRKFTANIGGVQIWLSQMCPKSERRDFQYAMAA